MITLQEIFDLVFMSVALGLIFGSFFNKQHQLFNEKAIKLAMIITAPAIVLHELGHKFVAMSFGVPATFHASYFGLGLGLFLVAVKFPFIFFVPGYVSIPINVLSQWQYGLIAFAGPLMNLLLYAGAHYLIKYNKKLTQKQLVIAIITKKINIFLFIINMIPLGGFDGAKVFSAILSYF